MEFPAHIVFSCLLVCQPAILIDSKRAGTEPAMMERDEKMKTLLTMKDIAKVASRTVSDYLANGYILSPKTGWTIYSDRRFHMELIRENGAPRAVRIGLFNKGKDEFAFEVREFDGDFATGIPAFAVERDGRLISSVRLYCIEHGRMEGGEVYTTSGEEYEEIRRKRLTRAMQRDCTVYGKDGRGSDGWCKACLRPEQVLGRVQETRGYKRTKAEDIRYVGKRFKAAGGTCSYYVVFNRRVSKAADWSLTI